MTDSDDREDGFYWIRIDELELEIAQWQSEWGQWLVAGSETPLSDHWASRITVWSGRLAEPPNAAVQGTTAARSVKLQLPS